MQNPFLYPSPGKQLHSAEAPPNTTIGDGVDSEIIGAGDCLEIMFRFSTQGQTGDVEVRSYDPYTTNDELFDTISLTGESQGQWNAGEALDLQLFLRNNSGDDISNVYCQKRIN